MTHFQVLQAQLKQKLFVSKLRVRIQRYTVIDFQGWSKMTPKIKIAHISILEVGFEKFFGSHLQNYIGKLKMITWN